MKRCAKDLIRTLGLSLGLSGLVIAAASVSALAQKKYDTGVTDTEIKIGTSWPTAGRRRLWHHRKTMSAYFRMINDNGGVNGRKINFISYDDAYSPQRPWSRRASCRERRGVPDFCFARTASNAAIQKYMNNMKCRSCSSPAAPRAGAIPNTSPGPSLAAELPGRGAHLCDLHPAAPPECQNWRAVSERRFRKGLRARAEGRAARQIRQDGRQRNLIRDQHADR